MTVVTTAQTTDASVSTARALVEYNPVDAVTLNTDLLLIYRAMVDRIGPPEHYHWLRHIVKLIEVWPKLIQHRARLEHLFRRG